MAGEHEGICEMYRKSKDLRGKMERFDKRFFTLPAIGTFTKCLQLTLNTDWAIILITWNILIVHQKIGDIKPYNQKLCDYF